MFQSACILSLYAETPVHPGTGATFGAIDLPVQRERHTGLPVLPSSSIKGVARAAARNAPETDEIFGSSIGAVDSFGGALSPTDGRLLLFPVRALEGIFVWTTCPFAIERLRRDADLVEGLDLKLPPTKDVDDLGLSSGSACVHRRPSGASTRVVLEDDVFSVRIDDVVMKSLVNAVASLFPRNAVYDFFRERLETHLFLVSDEDFKWLTESGTDVVTRNRLNAQKTTSGGGGGMWVQEFVPADSFFYSLLLAMPPRKEQSTLGDGDGVLRKAAALLADSTHLQIGGDESVGRGWMRTEWTGVPALTTS